MEYTKDEMDAAMQHIRSLTEEVNSLEALFPDRRFTLDGLLVGDLGEVAAAYYYGINLYKPSAKLHDGVADGKEVQIKTTQRDDVPIAREPEHLIVLYLNRSGKFYEVYNGPGSVAWESTATTDIHGNRRMRINKLMALNETISQGQRITLVHPIEKMRSEYKNPRRHN